MGEFSRPENIIEKPAKEKKKEREILSYNTILRDFTRMIEAAKTQENPKEFLIASARDYCESILGNLGKDMSGIYSAIEAADTDGHRTSARLLAEEVYNTIKTIQGKEELKQLESNIRHYVTQFIENDPGHYMLNEITHFNVADNAAFIHILPASTLSNPEKFRLFKDGLSKLAARLKNDPQFASIDEVEAISWIVKQYPGIVQRWGFAYDGDIRLPMKEKAKQVWEKYKFGVQKREPEARAHISREKLIRLHLSKGETTIDNT